MKKDNCALVIGGYVNGYSIIQELSEKGVKDIILFDTSRKVASYSNKIKKFIIIEPSSGCLLKELENLHKDYLKIIVFPTDDLQLENLFEIFDKISSYCFLPFNPENLPECLKKANQYQYCKILGIPFPKTIELSTHHDLSKVSSLQFPVLIKPNKRDDIRLKVFRNLLLSNYDDFDTNHDYLKNYILSGITFLASEIIPGDGSNIFAYVGYRSREGKILNEWTGKKLAQYPDDFGVFASASNQAPDEVTDQGRALLDGMNIIGIAEPEFKYDHRDGKYKLMEINLRSMMWHRVGNLSGVNIQYSQFLDAIGEQVKLQSQIKRNIHYVYLKHEILNLLKRKGYYRIFIHNLFNSDKTYLALFDIKDPKPFFIDSVDTIMMAGVSCLKALKII